MKAGTLAAPRRQNLCREAFERCESWQTEGMYAGTTDAMEANRGRQQSPNKCLRPECLVEAKDFESFDDWKAGCNAGTAKAYRETVWRDAGTAGADGYRAWRNRPAEHCKRPAKHFRGLKPVKRQPRTPIRSHCCGRGDALRLEQQGLPATGLGATGRRSIANGRRSILGV